MLIINDKIKNDDKYKRFRSALEKIKVNIKECNQEKYYTYMKLKSDIIIRISTNLKECLIGDRDPKTSTEKYEAKYILGNDVDYHISNFNSLFNSL